MTRRALAIAAACSLLALTLQGALAQPPFRAYLPLVNQPSGPPATVRFGATLAGGALGGVAASFPAGSPALYYEVTVEGAAGRPFTLEWTVNGQRRSELDRAGTLPADGGPYLGGIALSTSAPLPAGAYRLRVFIDGLPSGEGQASIQ